MRVPERDTIPTEPREKMLPGMIPILHSPAVITPGQFGPTSRLRDPDSEQSEKIHEVTDEVEPIYGKTYLPRKFKFGIALPEDNCVDIYTQDLGLLAIVEGEKIIGYNVLVGGGQGMTPAKKDTFPAVGQKMTFVTPDQTVAVRSGLLAPPVDRLQHDDRVIHEHAHRERQPGQANHVERAAQHAQDQERADDTSGNRQSGDQRRIGASR